MRSKSSYLFPPVVICFALTIGFISANHFYGATISWKPVNGTENAAKFFFKVWYAYNSEGSGKCTEATIGQLRSNRYGKWECDQGCTALRQRLAWMDIYCAAVDSRKTFEQGENSFTHTFPGPTATVRHQSLYGWRDVNYGENGFCPLSSPQNCSSLPFSLVASVDVRSRDDIGRSNSSPLAMGRPVYSVQYGCDREIKLVVSDPDDDIVKCRWSKIEKECAGVCQALPNATLDEDTCTLKIFGENNTVLVRDGWYAVAIQIEDFGKQDVTLADGTVISKAQPLSSIPFQFLVNTYGSNDSCDPKLEFLPPTPEDRSTVVLSLDEVYQQRVRARMVDAKPARKIGFTVQGPVGLNHTSGASLNPASNYSDSFHTDIVWSPTADQVGDQQVCFSAEDTGSKASVTRCVTIIVTNVDHCSPSPCFSNEICEAQRTGYRCIPDPSAVPVTASSDSCRPFFCLNGGTCLNTPPRGVHCVCPAGWTGRRCLDFITPTKSPEIWPIAVGSILGALVLSAMVTCAILVLITKRIKRKATEKGSPTTNTSSLKYAVGRKPPVENFIVEEKTPPLYEDDVQHVDM